MSTRLTDLDTIIFDLGQVIVDLQIDKVLERFKELTRNSDSDRRIPDLIRDTDLLIAYETGKMTTPEFIAATNKYLGAKISEDDFVEAWNFMIGDIPERRLLFMKELTKTHQVLILSNTNHMHEVCFENRIRDQYGTRGMADYVHVPLYSHLIQLRKPKHDIYEYVIENYLDDPSRAIFFDDKLENVEAAISCGMKSVQVAYPDQIFDLLV